MNKYELIRKTVEDDPGVGFYTIAEALVNAGYYTGKDLNERDRVNDDVNTVIAQGHIVWSNVAGGLVPTACLPTRTGGCFAPP